jgi:hypothetical protein
MRLWVMSSKKRMYRMARSLSGRRRRPSLADSRSITTSYEESAAPRVSARL